MCMSSHLSQLDGVSSRLSQLDGVSGFPALHSPVPGPHCQGGWTLPQGNPRGRGKGTEGEPLADALLCLDASLVPPRPCGAHYVCGRASCEPEEEHSKEVISLQRISLIF